MWHLIAAWGEVQNGQWGETFKVFHWELGVFLSPKLLGAKRLVPWDPRKAENESVGDVAIPLPFEFHPEPYNGNDRPWTVD
jgi:hypothetical protein